jgi:putative transposase
VKRAFKYRFYPTDAQAAELSRTFGCVRKVYNMALAAGTEAWALRQSLRHLQGAFAGFFGKRAKYPTFKSKKKSRRSAEYTSSAFRFRDGALTLAKMTEPLAVVWSRPLPQGAEPTTVTVSQDGAGRWHVSMLCEDRPATAPAPNAAVGIDAGITSLVTLSTGEKITNPKHERKDRERLAKAQRVLSRKAEGSSNRAKARLKVGRAHARIADRRRDFLHKLTTRLVRDNQTLVIEDLAVRNMVRNHTLARAVSDASWTEMRAMLEYKAAWYGRDLVVIDRWFPSTKLCSACGTIRGKLPLHVRTWTCDCGTTHDRDVNAAKNILAAGLAVNVCGDGVRPQRSTPGGQQSVKQKTQPARVGTPSH